MQHRLLLSTCLFGLIGSILLGLGGCTSIGKHITNPERLCTPSAAYGQGFQDGRRALAVHSDFSSNCPTNHTTINDAYHSGYSAGRASQH